MRKFLLVALFAALALAAYADEGIETKTSINAVGAYYPANLAGYGSTGFAPPDYSTVPGGAGQRDLGSSWGGAEAKASISRSWTIPALRGEGALMSGNNLALDATGEISPVSLNAVFSATLTPIAFLQFYAGAGIGTGWSLGFRGLALNPADDNQEFEDKPFGGAVWRAWCGGTFQFDFAALVPGEWNHVVILASPSVEYKAYTGAGADQAWLWEADSGMNFNGLKFKASYFLGYQMPIMVNTIGFLAETEEWLDPVRNRATMASAGGWGSDFLSLNFGPLANLSLGEGSSLAVLVQFKTARDWSDATTRNRYFENRDYEGGYLYFNRIAFSYTLVL
jgi:hypothetical protein